MQIIGQILTWILGLGTIAMAIGYIFAKGNEGANKKNKLANDQLEDANKRLNETLNELLGTQAKKIDELEKLHHQNQTEIANLTGRVEELSKKNGDLQQIINEALDRYFKDHPEEVAKLTINRSMRKADKP